MMPLCQRFNQIRIHFGSTATWFSWRTSCDFLCVTPEVMEKQVRSFWPSEPIPISAEHRNTSHTHTHTHTQIGAWGHTEQAWLWMSFLWVKPACLLKPRRQFLMFFFLQRRAWCRFPCNRKGPIQHITVLGHHCGQCGAIYTESPGMWNSAWGNRFPRV